VRILGAMTTELVVQCPEGASEFHLSREFVLQDECKKYSNNR
jgi:hypothetical protein